MEGLEHVLYFVVQKCKGAELTSASVRPAIKNLKYTNTGDKKAHEVANVVLNRLIEGGLAEPAEEDGATRGIRVRRCRWKSWADIQGNAASDAFLVRLGLGADDFA